MAFTPQPLNQSDFTMKIVEDLGRTTANTSTSKLGRYAIFECTVCKQHFKARASGATAKAQTSCQQCTRSNSQYYKHPLYAIWNGIRQRCYNTKRKDYSRYGGIGVTMCAEWKDSSDSFIEWCLQNGWKKELVVDKDVKCKEQSIVPTIYSPSTISFITAQQNAQEANAKCVQQYTNDGTLVAEHISCVEAAKLYGVNNKSTIANACRGLTKTAYGFVWKYKD